MDTKVYKGEITDNTGEEVNKWLEQHKTKGEKDDEAIKRF